MLPYNFHLALRRFKQEKLYTLVNILGLTLGNSCSLVLGLYVHNELNYDKHHSNHQRIYRVVNEFLIQPTLEERPHRVLTSDSLESTENRLYTNYIATALLRNAKSHSQIFSEFFDDT